MTVDEALEELSYVTTLGPVECQYSERTPEACRVLAAEVRRLRAGVEAVRALPKLDMYGEVHGIVMIPQDDGQYLDRADVLAALEVSDD